ncbi:hypothetical protein [Methylobacterium brachythecii]|uniref:Uncharacterized protein n=1 Tax=Methylobacterium brachythecii TaxID=1176177 RepID=A0A7W6F8X1_9HYPH|nr:hypothetical protein [Methylobacterium brachythecii]MBB3904566.1 hypothetical protein [Methylobacterium brachythecii]
MIRPVRAGETAQQDEKRAGHWCFERLRTEHLVSWRTSAAAAEDASDDDGAAA